MKVIWLQAREDNVAMNLVGHPTECLDKARSLAQMLIGHSGPWAFINLNFTSPQDRGLGWNRDSEWLLECSAIRKPV